MARWIIRPTTCGNHVVLFAVCLLLTIGRANSYQYKRQLPEGSTTANEVPNGEATPESKETTETFNDIFEEMFKDLGLDLDSDKTTENGVTTNSTTDESQSQTSSPETGDNVNTVSSTGTTDTKAVQTLQVTLASNVQPAADHITTNPQLSGIADNHLATVSPNYVQEGEVSSSSQGIITTSPSSSGTADSASSRGPSIQVSDATPAGFKEKECHTSPKLSDFCLISEELSNLVGPSTTLHELSDYILSTDIIIELTDKCPAGSWCLDSEHVYRHLEDKIAFWSNSSDFMNLCWQPIDACLRSVVDYYTGCENFKMYQLIAEMKRLLCEMKSEPMASRECIEQTLKALHVSMADFHRHDNDIGATNTDICKTREALMVGGYVCATDVCGDYDDLLNEFQPWEWFMTEVQSLQSMCTYDSSRCVTTKEQEADIIEEHKEESTTRGDNSPETTESSEAGNAVTGATKTDTTDSDSKEDIEQITNSEDVTQSSDTFYKSLWNDEEIDLPTAIVVGAIMVATLGFFLLIGLVVCLKRRRSRHRMREGVEYMEILADTDD